MINAFKVTTALFLLTVRLALAKLSPFKERTTTLVRLIKMSSEVYFRDALSTCFRKFGRLRTLIKERSTRAEHLQMERGLYLDPVPFFQSWRKMPLM